MPSGSKDGTCCRTYLLPPCEACVAGKAQRKNLSTVPESRPAIEEEPRVFMDLTFIKPKIGMLEPSAPVWQVLVDEHTQKAFMKFYAQKDDIVEPTCELLHQW